MSAEEDDDVLPKDGEQLKTKKDTYTAIRLLGKGGYGAVYEVQRKSDGKKWAIKCEKLSARKKVLPMDCRVLRGAQYIKSKHFCSVEDRGKVENRFIFLVMKLIGENLWSLRMERDSMKFTLNTSLKAAEQCLICIEELHRIGFLHRDIKPGNFAVGLPENQEFHVIFMLDFGLCRKFMEKDKDVRVPRENAPFRGTTRYASIAAMKQVEQSRKDDLEGWLYMVVEWTAGSLPWKKFKADNREEVLAMKLEVRENPEAMERLFKSCPKREFERIIKYIDELNYFSIPDYKFVYQCIQHAYKSNGIKITDPVDWDPKTEYQGPQGPPGDGKPIDMKYEDDEDEVKVVRKEKEHPAARA